VSVRIVSLLPSATEIVAALGLADRLVGVSAYYNRFGPRLVDGLEFLAHLIHPGLFPKTPAAEAVTPLLPP